MFFQRRTVKNNDQKRRFAVLLCVGVVCVLFVYLLATWSEKKALAETKEKAQNILNFQASNLVSHLNTFSLITALVSKRPDVMSIFRLRELDVSMDWSNQLNSITAGITGAKEYWFIDKGGVVFSSSDLSMIGSNVKDTDYFEAGFQGRLGRTSSVDRSGFRSYIFASPVFIDDQVSGLVAVKVDLEVVEHVWALLSEPIFATESTDRVLLSNVEAWRLNAFSSIIKNKKNSSEKEFYPIDHVTTPSTIVTAQARLINLLEPVPGTKSKQYLEVTKDVPLFEWRLHVLADLTPVREQRQETIVISLLMIALLLSLLWIMMERRRGVIARDREQKAFSLRLERQVRDRTHELTTTNTMLESEIVERRVAEKALRETQQDLIQAAKLAGIGQMSAALAHEYNQPLAAIRSYADNAQQLLNLKKNADVSANLTRITTITERMASLTKTLRSFVYKPESNLEAVAFSSVIDEMIILLSPQAKKQGVTLKIIPPADEVIVFAGKIRLSQVIINLVTNAIDALKESSIKCVEVRWYKKGSTVEIYVKDTGKGIPKDLQDKIFTSFFTTKVAGVGLGLGLFIVSTIVKEFRGTIELMHENNDGTEFKITLPLHIEPLGDDGQ